MPASRLFSAHVLWPWIIAPGIFILDFILVAIQVRLGLAGTLGACLALALPAGAAVILFIPHVRKMQTVPWESQPLPYNATSLLLALLMTIVRYAGGCFVAIGLCLGAAAFFAPSILLSISTFTTDPSPVPFVAVGVVTLIVMLWPRQIVADPASRDFQRGTSMHNIADARDSAEERMKKWEESDAP